MALIGNMIAEAFAGNPATVNYSMYTAAFSMLTLFYLVPASFNLDWALHPIIMIVVDLLNAIFFFACAIALAARLECHSCSNEVSSFSRRIDSEAPPANHFHSLTSRAMKSPMALKTGRSAVARPRPLLLSSGSPGPATWLRSSSRSSCPVLRLSTCAAALAAPAVALTWPRSKPSTDELQCEIVELLPTVCGLLTY